MEILIQQMMFIHYCIHVILITSKWASNICSLQLNGNDNNTPQVIPIILCFIHCFAVFVMMTCTLYTSQHRSGWNCKYYLAGKTYQHWWNKLHWNSCNQLNVKITITFYTVWVYYNEDKPGLHCK